jgi:hypothetical protein
MVKSEEENSMKAGFGELVNGGLSLCVIEGLA